MTQYLMHYTDFNGLKGILDNNYLRMTDVNTTNDHSEVRFGLDLIKEAMESEYKETKANIEKDLDPKKSLHYYLDDITHNYCKIFTLSFCRVSDSDDNEIFENGLLSQWRGYGSQQGFAIVFKKGLVDDELLKSSKCDSYIFNKHAETHYHKSKDLKFINNIYFNNRSLKKVIDSFFVDIKKAKKEFTDENGNLMNYIKSFEGKYPVANSELSVSQKLFYSPILNIH